MNTIVENKSTAVNSEALKVPIAVAMGDGIGPEIMNATLKILNAAGADIEVNEVKMGEKEYLAGNTSGISTQAWDTIRKNKVILKAPMTTPQGKGYKSLNVTLRKSLGLFANVRPSLSLNPFVHTHYPKTDVVVIRENEEDLYAGIEHQQTADVVQCLKLITRPGCERIIRYAFEYAKVHNRKKVTCMVKDNIMKLTDGLFHQVFDEIGEEYPDIEKQVQIIDIGTARLAARPEDYDVIVTSNLYGDVISDVASEIVGGVGLSGSANIGTSCALFEAIHGSAPDIAGKKIANPSGLINAAVMMLRHIDQPAVASKIKNAWLKTIEDGIHTTDIYKTDTSARLVNTDEFADAVIERLGQLPTKMPVDEVSEDHVTIKIPEYKRKTVKKALVGVDVFIDNTKLAADELGAKLAAIDAYTLRLKMITNRGVKVYPEGLPETFCTDHWRCRFVNNHKDKNQYDAIEYDHVIALLASLNQQGFDVVKTENLYEFDGKRSFSLGQGE